MGCKDFSCNLAEAGRGVSNQAQDHAHTVRPPKKSYGTRPVSKLFGVGTEIP